jgi:hypothetical protein
MIAQVTDPTSLAPLVAGPAAAVVVLLVVLYGLYLVVVKHLIPLAAKLGERHLSQFDRLLEAQREESKTMVKALQSIDRRLSRLEGGTDAGGLTVTQIHPNPGAQSPDRST